MNKYGVVTTESHCDFDFSKKAEFYDAEGDKIASSNFKHQLKSPKPISELNQNNNERLELPN